MAQRAVASRRCNLRGVPEARLDLHQAPERWAQVRRVAAERASLSFVRQGTNREQRRRHRSRPPKAIPRRSCPGSFPTTRTTRSRRRPSRAHPATLGGSCTSATTRQKADSPFGKSLRRSSVPFLIGTLTPAPLPPRRSDGPSCASASKGPAGASTRWIPCQRSAPGPCSLAAPLTTIEDARPDLHHLCRVHLRPSPHPRSRRSSSRRAQRHRRALGPVPMVAPPRRLLRQPA